MKRNVIQRKLLCISYEEEKLQGNLIYSVPICDSRPLVICCMDNRKLCRFVEKEIGIYLASRGVAFYCFEAESEKAKESIENVILYFNECKLIDQENIFLLGVGKLGLQTVAAALEYAGYVNGILLDCPEECDFSLSTSYTENMKEQINKPDFLDYMSELKKPVDIIHNEGNSASDRMFLEKIMGVCDNTTMHVISKYENGFFGFAARETVRKICIEFIQKNLSKRKNVPNVLNI